MPERPRGDQKDLDDGLAKSPTTAASSDTARPYDEVCRSGKAYRVISQLAFCSPTLALKNVCRFIHDSPQ
jgi:hypothetical protein